jgi:hypothetical protein
MALLLPSGLIPMKGFCTKAFLLAGKPLNVLEEQLGYRPGRLAAGATIYFLETLPTADQIQLAGYTYFSGGEFRGQKMESLLETEDHMSKAAIYSLKQKMIGTTIVVTGSDRLAKLVPTSPHSPGEEYPSGAGIFQVVLSRELPFRMKASISPGGVWRADFR